MKMFKPLRKTCMVLASLYHIDPPKLYSDHFGPFSISSRHVRVEFLGAQTFTREVPPDVDQFGCYARHEEVPLSETPKGLGFGCNSASSYSTCSELFNACLARSQRWEQ